MNLTCRWPLLIVLMALVGCGERTVADRLGLGRQAPDEFQVIQRAPLVLPPEFALRPPEPGVARPQEGTTSQQAQRALLGQALPDAPETTGQLALLERAGANQVSGDIRTVLANEQTGLVGLDEGRFWFILDFQRRSYGRGDGTALDAAAEAQRLSDAGIRVRSTRIASEPIAGPGVP